MGSAHYNFGRGVESALRSIAQGDSILVELVGKDKAGKEIKGAYQKFSMYKLGLIRVYVDKIRSEGGFEIVGVNIYDLSLTLRENLTL